MCEFVAFMSWFQEPFKWLSVILFCSQPIAMHFAYAIPNVRTHIHGFHNLPIKFRLIRKHKIRIRLDLHKTLKCFFVEWKRLFFIFFAEFISRIEFAQILNSKNIAWPWFVKQKLLRFLKIFKLWLLVVNNLTSFFVCCTPFEVVFALRFVININCYRTFITTSELFGCQLLVIWKYHIIIF